MEELRQMVRGRDQACRCVQMEESSLPAREQDTVVRAGSKPGNQYKE